MAKNGWKQDFDNTYNLNLLFHTQICSIGKQVVLNYPMVSPKVPATLVFHIFTLWATIATQLWAKIAKNGWKQVFDDTYLLNLLFHIQVCSMGQQVVFNYSMVSPKVPTALVTPNSYPMGHHIHSFVSKNGWKWLKIGFWQYLPP
jgi:hypothetical protein